MPAAPVGYLTNTRQPPVPTEPVADTRLALASLWDGGDKEKNEQQQLQFTDSTSALELFIMMRSGQLSPEIENNYTPNNTDVEGMCIEKCCYLNAHSLLQWLEKS